ncbi:citrate lyase holo-[acyl-carrier protein] synthase [Vibrio salinus]|uniref:citrate lyase holo-[acyl-carrier protein] synthase n=1 Tax=Vibrio salinus TaxID=2899784 RepID=UPI001E2C6306|nr:citrate lyase holo-[acyl-carrier protein] synthase [Vibrio salinus]MCE0492800.1 citrate lyase holo-[acyl-carrier protein] synthase [Vibrio salinus]
MNAERATEVGLAEHLANKEARVVRQNSMLARFSRPLVSLTINIPGPCKMTPASKKVFSEATEAVKAVCKDKGWNIVGRQITEKNTGPEAIFAIDVPDVLELKRAMIEIESSHRLGRLMDLDVCGENGKMVSRRSQEMALRKCLICDKPAVICARSAAHSLSELTECIERMVFDDKRCA